MSFMIDYILSSTKQTEKSLSLKMINSNNYHRIQQCSHCRKSFDRPSLLIRHNNYAKLIMGYQPVETIANSLNELIEKSSCISA